MTTPSPHVQLENLVLDPSFEALERGFGNYCPFEAMGAVHAELRHSAFLASMLDPNRPHGYGAHVLRTFLMTAVRSAADQGFAYSELSPLDIHLLSLDDAEIRREWMAIDLLVVLPSAKLIVAIELKINAIQGQDQLARYRKIVSETWTDGWRKLFVFLTKVGEQPKDERWLPLELAELASSLDKVVQTPGADPFAQQMLQSYLSMLRRHHMDDEKLEQIAARIWARHRDALEFLMERRPDALAPIMEGLHREAAQIAKRLSNACENAVGVDSETAAYIRFAVTNWDSIPGFCAGEGWTQTKRLILFELSKSDTELKISAILGPGQKEIRDRLFDAVKKELNVAGASGKQFKWLKSRVLIKLVDPDVTEDAEALKEKVLAELDTFFRETVPKIQRAIGCLSETVG